VNAQKKTIIGNQISHTIQLNHAIWKQKHSLNSLFSRTTWIDGTLTDTQPFYGSLDFVRDNPGEPVPEETFTHSHLSWSSVIPYLLPLSITIHSILPVQFTCLTDYFHNLSPRYLWSTSWPGTLNFTHFFIQSLSSFHSTYQYYHNLFCCSTEIMSSNTSLSLSTLYLCVYTFFIWNHLDITNLCFVLLHEQSVADVQV